jgi:hypothetical protein
MQLGRLAPCQLTQCPVTPLAGRPGPDPIKGRCRLTIRPLRGEIS